jgi:hypothetical protein
LDGRQEDPQTIHRPRRRYPPGAPAINLLIAHRIFAFYRNRGGAY